MHYTLPMYSGDDDRIAPSAFAGHIGRPITVRDGDKQVAGTLRDAIVDEDGWCVRLVLEVGEDYADHRRTRDGIPGRPRQTGDQAHA